MISEPFIKKAGHFLEKLKKDVGERLEKIQSAENRSPELIGNTEA